MTLLAEASKVSKPSKAELALALAIVKHKPPGTTVKDYISEIRQTIRRVDDTRPIITDKFWDSVHFWQTAYKRAEADQIKLLNTIFELEQKNEALLVKINEQSHPAKREALSEVENESNPDRKRARRRGPDLQSQQATASQSQPASDGQAAEKGVSFLRHIVSLQQALQIKRGRNGKANLLATRAVILCKEAERGLLTAVHEEISMMPHSKTKRIPSTNGPALIAVANAVELSVQLVHQALHKITAGSKNENSRAQVTYYLVCLFESTMTALAQYCTAVSKTNHADSANTTITRVEQQRKSAGSDRRRPGSQPAPDQVLTDLLCKTALSLDMAKSCDQPVMEGFLFLLADRVGKMLALFNFDGIQIPYAVNTDLQPPKGLAEMQKSDISPQIAQKEAKSLITILNKVLKNKVLFPLRDEVASSQGTFMNKIQKDIQKTLLQAVFGKEDPLFHNGLARPTTPPPTDCVPPVNKRKLFNEWFTEELWALIGWEILCPETRAS